MREPSNVIQAGVRAGEGTGPGVLDFVASRRPLEWTVPVAIAAFVVRMYLSGQSFALERFTGRTVGVSVLHGVDVARRTRLLFEATALFLVVMCVSLVLDR